MKIKNRSLLLVVALGLMALLLWPKVLPTSLAQGDDPPWPMFRYDIKHTGRSPHTGPDNPGAKWTFQAGGPVTSSPAIGADCTIYVGSNDNKFYALNPDGTEKWHFNTQGSITSSPAIGADGTIYIGSEDNNLYALNPDGSQKWSFATRDGIHSSPVIASDGTIYITSTDRTIYAINPDGTEKWGTTEGRLGISSPVIGADGTIYAASTKITLPGYYASIGRMYAFDPNDGSLMWRTNTTGGLNSSPAIGTDGTIYVGSTYDRLGGTTITEFYALNPDGTEKWSFPTQGAIISSPAIGADGIIYVGSSDNNLYAVNPDGTEKWSYLTQKEVTSSPTIGADETIYVGSNDRKLYAIGDASTLPESAVQQQVAQEPTEAEQETGGGGCAVALDGKRRVDASWLMMLGLIWPGLMVFTRRRR